jgi:hypothetical protein
MVRLDNPSKEATMRFEIVDMNGRVVRVVTNLTEADAFMMGRRNEMRKSYPGAVDNLDVRMVDGAKAKVVAAYKITPRTVERL